MRSSQTTSAFPEVFAAIKQLLAPYAKTLKVTHDSPVVYTLSGTVTFRGNARETMLISVASMKNYVSLHLMPVYMCPETLDDISPELKRRMQGKACFNFTQVDDTLFQEAAALVKKSIAACKAKNLV